jgi:hypothetical protein
MSSSLPVPQLGYRKIRDRTLFDQLETVAGLATPQNYNPIHNQFFALNESNAQNVVIGAPKHIMSVVEQTGECSFKVVVEDEQQQNTNAQCFVKFSPLLDPLKHITGAYTATDITTLPSFLPDGSTTHTPHPKTIRPNNSSYVDALFSLLSALLKQNSGITNLIDCYGCFLGVKRGYRYMLTDDIDLAHESSHFMDNLGTLFTLEGGIPYRSDSLSRKPALSIGDTTPLNCVEASSLITELFEDVSPAASTLSDTSAPIVLRRTSQCSSESSTSSNEENTDEENTDEENTDEDEDLEEELEHAHTSVGCSDSDDEPFSETEEDETYCRMKEFPCVAIFLEQMTGTLESLMNTSDLSDNEWASALFQVTVTLAYLQRVLNFTHNDLHTSNIMYIPTDKTFLCYKINGQHYKVPTYGRIFKIIDFGRSIFEYEGLRFCSDSFQKGEDAAGQYNCAPFRDDSKPELPPNMSFDLCRLGCSLFDYFLPSVPESSDQCSPLETLIAKWCCDAQGKNVLYKSNGEERYPGFKLYKMIARRVVGLEPIKVLEQEPVFASFLCARKKLGRLHIFNLDATPDLTQKSGSLVNTPTA